ncbi:hypothetical protein [Enterococcus mediterraneensis]|uniref:hypothetical protein n=1 Tax=Enterococcus mediterraneensis TaxID=2364791 RepID=UPI000F061BD0|nr:hypothetical protein [Enterococcus mediterraneensis]
MLKKSGIVTKIKILNTTSKTPLIYFKLDDCNCLIAAHSLSFLADVAENTKIVISGLYNSRKQFVVKKYAVVGMTKIMMEFEMMRI